MFRVGINHRRYETARCTTRMKWYKKKISSPSTEKYRNAFCCSWHCNNRRNIFHRMLDTDPMQCFFMIVSCSSNIDFNGYRCHLSVLYLFYGPPPITIENPRWKIGEYLRILFINQNKRKEKTISMDTFIFRVCVNISLNNYYKLKNIT